MKRKILLSIALLVAQITSAQVIYSENFDNLTVGNVGTDPTGLTKGKGGWSTLCHTDAVNQSNNYFKIVAEPGRGNVIEISCIPNTIPWGGNILQFKDLNLLWQNRTQGNDICKIELDFYTDTPATSTGLTNFYLLANNLNSALDPKKYIAGYSRYIGSSWQGFLFSYNLGDDTTDGSSQGVNLPENSWVKVIFYLDYANNITYLNIPSMNVWQVKNTFLINSTATNLMDEFTPTSLLIQTGRQGATLAGYKIRYDNITVSALNTVPNASLENILSSKLNVFPNPATNIVTITNNENMQVKQVNIYNISGKQLRKQNFNSTEEIQLNVESLSSGTYMLHIQSDSGTAVKKLIKK